MITPAEERALREFFGHGSESDALIENARARIFEGEPLAYIVGKQYFCNLELAISRDTLIPRPDTERVVECAVKTVKKGGRFLDLCTGSGAIALALADLRRDLTGVGVEISEAAYNIALLNRKKCSLVERVSFLCADIFEKGLFEGELFDSIISNPPYIPSGDIKKYPSLSYEPLLALDGGSDGLDFYRGILESYSSKLNENGFFIFEIGYDQGDGIKEIAKRHGYDCRVSKDYSGNDRVALLTPFKQPCKDFD